MNLYWVTNIPTPYRNHRYAKMAEIFPEYGIDFEVLYMAWTEPDRHWTFEPSDFEYDYSVYGGIQPEVGGMYCHFSPGLLARLVTEPRDIVVIGGYASPTHWLASMLCPSSALKLLSAESNMDSTVRTEGLAVKFKQYLISQHDGYVITGERTRTMLEWFEPGAASKPFVTLPNLIDKSIYSETVHERREEKAAIRERLGVNEDTQLWMCPARLEPRKGLHLLIPQMANLKSVELVVAGSGSQMEELAELARQHRVNVTFLGQQTTEEMIDLYAAADLFALPSLRDPSPLSPIEACAAELPLLISSRVGNIDDVLSAEENGWVFDADHPEDSRPTIEKIAELSREQLAEVGQRSKARYEETFDSDRCIHRLAQAFVGLQESAMKE